MIMVSRIDPSNSSYCANTLSNESIQTAPLNHALETSSISAATEEKTPGQTWGEYFYNLYVDCYTYSKTHYLRIKGWLGLGPNLAVPDNHPSKRPIEELTILGGLLWARTLHQCFCLLLNRHSHIHVDTSFLHNLTPPHALNAALLKQAPPHASLVFIPLFIQYPGGNHYTIVSVDLSRKTVEYYDSEGFCNLGNGFLKGIQQFYFPGDSSAKILVNKDRAQWDIHSCGVHVMDYANRRAKGESFRKITKNPTSTWDIEGYRLKLAKNLLYAKPNVIRQLRLI